MNYQKVYMNHIHSSSLLCQLAQMWRSQLLCDALICTGNVVTKAHRVVLLAACPMLQSMENASIGTELEVRLAADIKQEAVNTFLQYLYEGFMLLTEDNVKHVEKVARLLQVDSVVKCCSDFFKCLEKSTGRLHNGNYKFDKYDLLEFRHVRATGLQKTYHDRLMKRISESPHSPSPTSGKRQRMQRPSSPPSDFTAQRTDDARTMTQSYMTAMPSGGAGSVRSGTSSRSDSPSVVEIIEDSLELIQREKPVPGQPEPSRLSQQKTSISVASHVSNAKDTRVVSIADDSGGSRTWTTDSFSDRLQGIAASQSSVQQTSSQMSASPKIPYRDQAKASHHQALPSFMQRIPPNQMSSTSSSQPPPPPLQQGGTLNIAPLSLSFSSQEQSSDSRPSQMSSDIPAFATSTPQRSHATQPSPGKLSFAAGSASQAVQQSTTQQQDSGQGEKTEKEEGDSSRPQEGHDPGPSESSEDTADLAIVKIEKVDDETGGLLMQVDNGQGDGQRSGQYMADEEHEYDESDLTGDFSQDDVSNEASMLQGDQSGAGSMYMGPTTDYTTTVKSEEPPSSDEVEAGIVVKPKTGIECTQCGKLCISLKVLNKHHIDYHSFMFTGKIKCSYCNFACNDQDEMKAHYQEAHKHVCKQCNKAFGSFSAFHNHKRLQHGSKDKVFSCRVCGYACPSLSRLKIHATSHSNTRMYKCPICAKEYKYKHGLDHHIRSFH